MPNDAPDDDAPALLDMIAKTPNLDRVLALPPERFRSPAARRAFTTTATSSAITSMFRMSSIF